MERMSSLYGILSDNASQNKIESDTALAFRQHIAN